MMRREFISLVAHQLPMLVVLLSVCGLIGPAYPRGGFAREHRWNPEHIRQLPVEVRSAVMQMCSQSPRAEHYFATYFQNSRLIKLHFEHFHCDGGAPLCNQSGCLHQEYISTGGHYRLLRSFYGPDND